MHVLRATSTTCVYCAQIIFRSRVLWIFIRHMYLNGGNDIPKQFWFEIYLIIRCKRFLKFEKLKNTTALLTHRYAFELWVQLHTKSYAGKICKQVILNFIIEQNTFVKNEKCTCQQGQTIHEFRRFFFVLDTVRFNIQVRQVNNNIARYWRSGT